MEILLLPLGILIGFLFGAVFSSDDKPKRTEEISKQLKNDGAEELTDKQKLSISENFEFYDK